MVVFSASFPSKLIICSKTIQSPQNNCAGGVLQLLLAFSLYAFFLTSFSFT